VELWIFSCVFCLLPVSCVSYWIVGSEDKKLIIRNWSFLTSLINRCGKDWIFLSLVLTDLSDQTNKKNNS